jgi:CpeT protein
MFRKTLYVAWLAAFVLAAFWAQGCDAAGSSGAEEIAEPTDGPRGDAASADTPAPAPAEPDVTAPADLREEVVPVPDTLPADVVEPSPIAPKAAAWLEGRFDSSAQEKADPQYFAIQLWMCRVEAPELGEHVLYVEQAMMSSKWKPYRQRLYVVEPLEPASLKAVSRVFELKDPDAVIGLCEKDESVSFTAAMVEERQGCHVALEWTGEGFVGGTHGKGCGSTLNGASYATSKVELYADRLTSWDQGFNGDDVQVWGATAGPYIFDRKTPLQWAE